MFWQRKRPVFNKKWLFLKILLAYSSSNHLVVQEGVRKTAHTGHSICLKGMWQTHSSRQLYQGGQKKSFTLLDLPRKLSREGRALFFKGECKKRSKITLGTKQLEKAAFLFSYCIEVRLGKGFSKKIYTYLRNKRSLKIRHAT